MPVIYKITNPAGSIYIGQSWNMKSREASYRGAHCADQKNLYSSIKKYGWDLHKLETLHELPVDVEQSTLDKYETLYWELHRECNLRLMNIRFPGSRGRLSESTKQKMRKPKPAGFGKKGVKNPLFGTKRPEQSIARQGSGNPFAKRVAAYTLTGDLIGVYGSQTEAAKALGLKHTTGISSCCTGKRQCHFEYIFKYA